MPIMLICETQEDLAVAMAEFFTADGYDVELENNGLRVLHCLREKQYDVVILEMALHGLDGLSVVRDYRAIGGNTPILLLTNKVSSLELQDVFDTGADAYVTKPFQLADLAAQLRALQRRPKLRHGSVLNIGNITVDTEAGTVTKNDVMIHLFPMEFKLLLFLMRHPDQAFNTHAIFERVWQKEVANMDDTVRTHIRTLRSKIDTSGCPSIIITVRGLGYKTKGP